MRLIDADALIAAIEYEHCRKCRFKDELHDCNCVWFDFLRDLEYAPTVDIEEL